MKRRLLQLRGWLPAVYHNVEVTARRRAHISQRVCRLLTFPTFLRSPFATKSAIREMKVDGSSPRFACLPCKQMPTILPSNCLFYRQQSYWRTTMKFREKLKKMVQNRRAFRELSSLDDRTLEDLGVSRSNILAAVEGRR